MRRINLAMLIDFYELTMANGYLEAGKVKEIVYFDLFYRSNPDDGGYAIFAGLESIIDYLDDLKFEEEDIEYLKSKNMFSVAFLKYLKTFKFSGDIYGFEEGSIIFPNEPILTVKAPIIEAQLIETYLLQVVNHQSLIATKASRIKYASQEKQVIEMGARRAHGLTSSLAGARAAYIGGVEATSNVLADQIYKVPAGGTMAHSFVQSFDSEYEAFKAYAQTYPENTTLLVDTYDTLKSGVKNAIKVIKEELVPKGIKDYSIRLDSGDLTYLAKESREMLDEAGLENCKITASNSLDERIIKDLLIQGAPIDVFGVGERLITAKSDPVFGSVYKLVAVEKNDEIVPKIKISENTSKITTPGFKTVYRILGSDKHFEADLIAFSNESFDSNKTLTIFDPDSTWKKKTFSDYQLINMHKHFYHQGKRIYDKPSLDKIKEYCQNQLNGLWEEVRRFDNPHIYYVDLSKKLWDTKNNLINKFKQN